MLVVMCRYCILSVLSSNTEGICISGMEESDDDKVAGMQVHYLPVLLLYAGCSSLACNSC